MYTHDRLKDLEIPIVKERLNHMEGRWLDMEKIESLRNTLIKNSNDNDKDYKMIKVNKLPEGNIHFNKPIHPSMTEGILGNKNHLDLTLSFAVCKIESDINK
jgi:hypothetical protein